MKKLLIFDCLNKDDKPFVSVKEKREIEKQKKKSFKKRNKKLNKEIKQKQRIKTKQKKERKIINRVKNEIGYKVYIKSVLWKERRKKYYYRHKKECFICGSIWKIGLHHLSYKNLGCEKDKDLVALCWKCHKTFHKYHKHEKVFEQFAKELKEYCLFKKEVE